MNLPAHAALSLNERRDLCQRVVEEDWTLAKAAEAAEVSVRCARKWVGRYRAEGVYLLDARSEPGKQRLLRSVTRKVLRTLDNVWGSPCARLRVSDQHDVQGRLAGDELVHQRPCRPTKPLAKVRRAHDDVCRLTPRGNPRYRPGNAAVGLDRKSTR